MRTVLVVNPQIHFDALDDGRSRLRWGHPDNPRHTIYFTDQALAADTAQALDDHLTDALEDFFRSIKTYHTNRPRPESPRHTR